MTAVRLPARDLAVAWANVSLAAATDKAAASVLLNTVSVEIYGASAVRLVAADGALLLTSWVGAGEPDPGLGVLPDSTIVVSDVDGLAKGFMSHLLKATKADGDDQWREVTMTARDVTTTDQPAFSGLAKQGFQLDTDDHRVQLNVIDSAFPSWRAAGPTPDREAPVERIAVAPDYLAVLGKLKGAGSKVSLTFHTAKGPAIIRTDGEPAIAGLVRPKALTDDEVQVDQLQALWDTSGGGEDE
jgi:hypothetical protein